MKKIMLVITIVISLLFKCTKLEAINPSSYCVMECSSKKIIKQSNSNTQSLVASTAKIMTALVALNNIDIYDYVNISKEDQNMIGSKVYLEEDDCIKYIDLIYGLMLRSGNDCANALANNTFDCNKTFVNNMNETAKKIGMKNSVFANASGLDEEEYNLSTSYDMCLLMTQAMKNDLFREITGTKNYKTTTLNNKSYSWSNKHKLVLSYPEFIGGKTGYTKKSGRILVSSVFKEDLEYVIVTINNSNDWVFHKSIANSLTNYSKKRILKKGIYDTSIKDFDYYFINYTDIVMYCKKDEEVEVIIEIIEMDVFINFYINECLVSTHKGDLINKYSVGNKEILDIYF